MDTSALQVQTLLDSYKAQRLCGALPSSSLPRWLTSQDAGTVAQAQTKDSGRTEARRCRVMGHPSLTLTPRHRCSCPFRILTVPQSCPCLPSTAVGLPVSCLFSGFPGSASPTGDFQKGNQTWLSRPISVPAGQQGLEPKKTAWEPRPLPFQTQRASPLCWGSNHENPWVSHPWTRRFTHTYTHAYVYTVTRAPMLTRMQPQSMHRQCTCNVCKGSHMHTSFSSYLHIHTNTRSLGATCKPYNTSPHVCRYQG